MGLGKEAFELVDAKCSWCGASCKAERMHTLFGALCEPCQRRVQAFWDEFHKRKFEHVCDIPMEELFLRHAEVMELKKRYDPHDVGTLLIGTYYGDAWSSRSCSGRLADMFDLGDYMAFYCGSSDYVHIVLEHRDLFIDLIEDFEEADAKDRKRMGIT